jgi:hypothetical protein
MIVDKGYPIMFDAQQCILAKTIQLNKVIVRGQKEYKMVCIVLSVACQKHHKHLMFLKKNCGTKELNI